MSIPFKQLSLVAIVDPDGEVIPNGLSEYYHHPSVRDFLDYVFRNKFALVDETASTLAHDILKLPSERRIPLVGSIRNIEEPKTETIVVGSPDTLREALPLTSKLYLIVLRKSVEEPVEGFNIPGLAWGRIIYEQEWDISDDAEQYDNKGPETHTYVILKRV